MFIINHKVPEVKVSIEFKALDRLIDYLEAADQKKLDQMTEAVINATARLKSARSVLANAVNLKKEN